MFLIIANRPSGTNFQFKRLGLYNQIPTLKGPCENENQIRKKRELEVIIERHQYKLNLWEQKK